MYTLSLSSGSGNGTVNILHVVVAKFQAFAALRKLSEGAEIDSSSAGLVSNWSRV